VNFRGTGSQLFNETSSHLRDIVVTAQRQTVQIEPSKATSFRLSTEGLSVIQTMGGGLLIHPVLFVLTEEIVMAMENGLRHTTEPLFITFSGLTAPQAVIRQMGIGR